MGIYAFRLPDIGEGVVEGEVVQWHVEAGTTVSEDDALIDVININSVCVAKSKKPKMQRNL